MELNMRLYIFLSHIGLASVLFYSYLKYGEFYTSMVYLSTEKFPKTVIYNFLLMIFIVLCKFFLNIFIGELRYLEVEQLIDNARAFIMDTILFLVLSKPTINGKEVSSVILIKYLSLIVILKAYHLILYSRVSHMFELGVPRIRILVKLFIFMCLLSIANLTMFTYFYKNSLKNSTMYLWLFFESLSIFESCQISIFKFFVNIIDLRSANGLSSKATILFFLDMLHDIMSLIIFLVFILVFILNNFSNLPLHMTADIIHVVKALISRFKSFQRYRELTKNIESKFVDATEEELKEVGTCIICRDDLKKGAKKLSCGHIFHIECLKSWFIQQQTCPICRSEIKPYANTENKQKNENENSIKKEKLNQCNLTEMIQNGTYLPNEEFDILNEAYSINNNMNITENTSNNINQNTNQNINQNTNQNVNQNVNQNTNQNINMNLNQNENIIIDKNLNINSKEYIKILINMCDYYKELCLACLREIDKINCEAVPASVMLRNIYSSVNYNILNNSEDDDILKILNKLSHVSQINAIKIHLEKILISDMNHIKDLYALL